MHHSTLPSLLLALAAATASTAQAREFDYLETFDDDATFTLSTALPDGWSAVAPTQAIQRYKGATLGTGTHSGSYVLGTLPTTGTRDDYAFTRSMRLQKGVTYEVSFWVCMPGGVAPMFTNEVSLSVGTAPTAAACTQQLGTTGNVRLAQWTQQTFEFTPTATADYHFALHIATALYQAGSVAIDDFHVSGSEPDPSLPTPDPDKTVVELPYSQSFDNENDDYHGGFVPDGWLSVGDYPFRTAQIAGFKAKDGDYYLVAPESALPRTDRVYTSFFPMLEGTDYDLSFHLYMPGDGDACSDFRLTVGEEQDADFHTDLLRLDSVRTNGWQQVKVRFTPDHSGYYCFSFALGGEAVNAGEAGIDLLEVTSPGMVARPKAEFGFNGTFNQMNSHLTLVGGQKLQLINRSTGADTYHWEMPGADPAESSEANPVVSFPSSGTYELQLTATNVKGESRTSRTVNVDVVEEAQQMPLTVYDPMNETLMMQGTLPYFPTAADNTDFATGVNHYYTSFAQRFNLPEGKDYRIASLTLFLCDYTLSNAVEGAERQKKVRFVTYPEADGRPDTAHPTSSAEMTLGEAFGTMGLAKAEMRSIALPEPLKASGPFYLALEFDPTITIDVADTHLARTIIGLGGFYHNSGRSSFYARPTAVPEDCTYRPDGGYCPIDSIDAQLAGLGLNVTAWMTVADGTPSSIDTPFAPDGQPTFAARFHGQVLEVGGLAEGTPLTVTDTAGRTLLRTRATAGVTSLQASQLPAGTYVVNGVKVLKP